MLIVNTVSCEPDDAVERGAFHAGVFDLTERLGASVIGASVYEMRAGPGRVVIFSAGARGWGEAFVSVYPDSDKIAAAPGVMFRRADAIGTWRSDAGDAPIATAAPASASGSSSPALNLVTASLQPMPGERSPDEATVLVQFSDRGAG